MKRIFLACVLVVATQQAVANFTEQQAGIIGTYLDLNKTQQKSVLQIFEKHDEAKRQKHKELASKGASINTKQARQKNKEDKPKARKIEAFKSNVDVSKGNSISSIILRIAFNTAKKNPAINAKLKKLFTAAQYEKWAELEN